MRKRLLLFLTLIAAIASSAFADEAFRTHRYDAFKPLPITSEDIVFVGNSITNMNEWWEWFGSDPRIKNRGNSGGMAIEWNHEFESVLKGKPAKLFLMIGTNEIGSESPKVVANKVRALIERCKNESPSTELYVQSILPSTNGRTLANISAANELIAGFCTELDATYVNLYDSMTGINSGVNGDCSTLSFDHLHLTAKGYRIWVDLIKNYIGSDATISVPENPTQNNAGINNSPGMRITYFSVLPVASDDILFIGDEMVHGGEWKEYLRCPNFKNRGNGWGNLAGLSLDQHLSQIPVILHDGATPKAVLLNLGMNDNTSSNNWNNIGGDTGFVEKYTAIINKIHELSPETHVFVTSQYPMMVSNTHNTARIVPANTLLSNMVTEMNSDKVHYIDIYTPLINDAGNNIKDGYATSSALLSGKGYVAAANAIGSALKEVFPDLECNPVTMEEAEAEIATYNARTPLASAISDKSLSLIHGSLPGQYSYSSLTDLYTLFDSAYDLLNNETSTETEKTAKISEIENFAVTTTNENYHAGAPTEDGWYFIAANDGSPATNNVPYVVNGETSYFQSKNNFYYPLEYVAAEDTSKPGRHLIFIEHGEGSNITIKTSKGHYVTFQGVESATSADITLTDRRPGDWSYYSESDMTNAHVGGGSRDNAINFVYRKADMSDIDVYEVQIIGATAANNVVSTQPSVVFNNNLNLGVSSAFDGGFFFVPKGSELTPDMFTINTATVTNTNAPVVVINADQKKIYVDLDGGYEAYFLSGLITNFDNLKINEGVWVKMRLIEGTNDTANGLITAKTNEVITIGFPHRQYDTHSYSLQFNTHNADSIAQTYLYITKASATTMSLRSINGFYVQNNCINSRSNANFTFTKHTSIPGAVKLGNAPNWSYYDATEPPLVGGSSNTNNYFAFSLVSPEELENFEIYSVIINGAPQATQVRLDTRIQLKEEYRHINNGISTLYNGGRFFFDKGTTVTPEMFDIIPTDETLTPTLTIDEDKKIILLNYGYIPEDGWYEIQLTYPSSAFTENSNWVINKSEEFLHNGNYYPLRITAKDESHPATALFYLTMNSNGSYDFTGLNGHIIDGAGVSSRTINQTTGVSITSEDNGLLLSGSSRWASCALNNNGGGENPHVGGAYDTQHRWTISLQDVAEYDIWQVKMIDDSEGENIKADPRVTCSSDANLGIASVYENGYFFFPAGTEVTAGMFSADQSAGMDGKIIIDAENKTITADYRPYAESATIALPGNPDLTTLARGDSLPAPTVTINPTEVAPTESTVTVTPSSAATINDDGTITINEAVETSISAIVTNPDGSIVTINQITFTPMANVTTVELAFNLDEGQDLGNMAKGDIIPAPSVSTDADNSRAVTEIIIEPASAASEDASGKITILQSGEFTIKAKVTNPDGSTAESTPQTVTVAPDADSATISLGFDITDIHILIGDVITPVVTTQPAGNKATYELSFSPADAVEAVEGQEDSYTLITAGPLTITATISNPHGDPFTQTLNINVENLSTEVSNGAEPIEEEEAEGILDEIAAALGEEVSQDVAENLKGTITLDLYDAQSVNQELTITLNTNFEIEETWTEVTSSNPNVAVYLGEGNKIQTVGVGTTLITIKVWRKLTAVAPEAQILSRDGSEDSAEKGEPAAIAHYWMTVTDNALKLSVDRLRVEVGKEATVAIEAENPDGYVWTVADTSIATITVEGNTITVSGLNPGQTTITGTRGSHTVNLDVTVFTYILGIDAVNADAASGRTAIFDLSGRRLSAIARPGLYIINGEKVYVK